MRQFQGWLDDHEPLVALTCVAVFFALSILLSGCGSKAAPPKSAPAHLTATPIGCMGPCVPTLKVGLPPKAGATRPRLPDTSEWQPCVNGAVPTVFRLAYGSRQDTRAACNGRYLAAHRVWRAGYTYLTGACAAEGRAAASIARAVGGVNLIIADGETTLPAHCLADFRAAAGRASGDPTATYTGCYSGLPRESPLWVPSYGASPACGPFKAWQYSDGSFCGESYVTDCSFDYGITSIGAKPKPTPKPNHAQLKAELYRDYGLRTKLRTLLTVHRCRTGHAKPARYWTACGVWFRHGASTNRAIRALHARGIF